MSSMPRLLPLIAVSIVGVLAVKALNGAQALPDLLSAASAHAEAAPKPVAPKAGAAAARSSPAVPPLAAAAPAPKPIPACAISPAELAKEAGLSPGELQTLQNLQARRGQLDDRERKLDTQIQLLAAAEAKVDAKIKAMNTVKGQIQGLLGQADQQQQADVDRLTNVYQKMKPSDAAAVMATLEDKVRIAVVAKMKDSSLAAILGKMPTAEAKKLTESLAQRADAAKAALKVAEQAAAQPAPTAVAAASPDPTAPPAAAKPKPHRQAAGARRKTPHEAVAAQVHAVPVIMPTPAKTAATTPATPAKAPTPTPKAGG